MISTCGSRPLNPWRSPTVVATEGTAHDQPCNPRLTQRPDIRKATSNTAAVEPVLVISIRCTMACSPGTIASTLSIFQTPTIAVRRTCHGHHRTSTSTPEDGRNVPLMVRKPVHSSAPETGGKMGCRIAVGSASHCTLPRKFVRPGRDHSSENRWRSVVPR